MDTEGGERGGGAPRASRLVGWEPRAPQMLIRSLLIAPGNRPDLLKKFPRCDADAFVIDLEDGTPEAEKAAARRELAGVVAYLRGQGLRGLLFVRTNEPSSPHTDADLGAALPLDIDGIVVPKLATQAELQRFGAALNGAARRAARPPVPIGSIETARGVVHAQALANGDPHLCALCFGGEDFISDMGGRRTAEGLEVLYARSQVVLAARAAGLSAIDQVVVEIRDDERFRRDSLAARNLGYGGKMCLLPRQVELANELFSPAPEEIERSQRLVAAYEVAVAEGRGVIDFEGRMIDPPLLKRARSMLELAVRLGKGH
jgi:citrate lyase subunit beta / citryl-CoA lyase